MADAMEALQISVVPAPRLTAFRRVCLSVAAYFVVFVLSHTLAASGVAPGVAYQLLIATAILDSRLLWTFFRRDPAA